MKRTNKMYSIFLLLCITLFCCMALSPIPAHAENSQLIPIPTGQQSFLYCPVDSPLAGVDPSLIKPLGVGPVASGGKTFNFFIDLDEFNDYVDLYLGIYSPSISEEIYLLTKDDTFQPLSSGLPLEELSLEENVKRIWTYIFSNENLATSLLPPGNYGLSLLATPAGSIDKYYLWNTSFTVTPSYFSISPSCIDFGTNSVGNQSPRTVTITNPGNTSSDKLRINSIDIGPSTDFLLSNDNCSGKTLSPTNTCTFGISFIPSSEGFKYLDLSIDFVTVNTNTRAGIGPASTNNNISIPLFGTAIQQPCTYDINPQQNLLVPSSGGTYTIAVTAPTGCNWTAARNESWITITSGSGSGNGTVSYTVSANPAADPRGGIITIADKSFTVAQSGTAPVVCTYQISPPSATFSSAGGSGTLNVYAPAGCEWWAKIAYSGLGWIEITSPRNGTGYGTVTYSVLTNITSAPRTGAITVEGNTLNITQTASGCTYTISTSSAVFYKDGGSGSFTVTTGSTCSWTARSDSDWITITSNSSGTGTKTVSYSVSSNTTTATRTGIIYVGGKQITITQYGSSASCTPSLNPTSQSFSASSGSGSFTVTIGSDCSWSATPDVSWISITSGTSGKGNGTVNYTVSSNSGAVRTGTITVNGKTHAVTQLGSSSSGINYTDLIIGHPIFSSNAGKTADGTRSAKFFRFTIPSGGCATGEAQVWLAGWVPDSYNNNMLLSDHDFGTVENALGTYMHFFYVNGIYQTDKKASYVEYPAGSGLHYWYNFTGSGEAEDIRLLNPIPNYTYYLSVIGETTEYSQWRLTVYCY